MGRNAKDFWQQKVTDFNSSGKAAVVFCRENNLNCKTFYIWIQRLLKDSLTSTTKSNFNEIQISPSVSQNNFLINIANLKWPTCTELNMIGKISCGFTESEVVKLLHTKYTL